MNKMKEVAQLLGVELNEEFEIPGGACKFKITNKGLMKLSTTKGTWDDASSSIMDLLLLGKFEIKKPILNKQEKQYLENVVKPFKNRVKYIAKHKELFNGDLEYIMISVRDDYSIFLPKFKSGSMYNGMEANKTYTLKELRLFEYE